MLIVVTSHSAVGSPAKAEALLNGKAGQPSDFAFALAR
jgi:hypothetical protein